MPASLMNATLLRSPCLLLCLMRLLYLLRLLCLLCCRCAA